MSQDHWALVGAAPLLSEAAATLLATEKAARMPGIAPTPDFVAQIRAASAAMGAARKAALQVRLQVSAASAAVGGVPVVRVAPIGGARPDRRMLYLHGGAFVFGEAHDTGSMLLASRYGAEVISIDYRLAPEHPFPAGLEDGEAVYRALVADGATEGLVVVGMSAGATLAATLLSTAQSEGLPPPAAAVLLTPGADLKVIGDSLEANDGRDPVLTWTDQLDKALQAYLGDRDAAEPRISPARATYAPGYPRSLIVTGTRDFLLSPCVRLYWAMRRGGVEAELRLWDGMWHGFTFTPDLPEAEDCLGEIADFLGWSR